MSAAQLFHRNEPLTSGEIRRIKLAVASGTATLKDIQKRFRISKERIHEIVGKQTGNIKERW